MNDPINESTLFVILCEEIDIFLYTKFTEIFGNDKELIFITNTQNFLDRKNIIYIENIKLFSEEYMNIVYQYSFNPMDAFFYYIKERNNYQYYWLINSETFLNKEKINNFLSKYNSGNSDFISFGKNKKILNSKHRKYFPSEELIKSFNPICRLSQKLVSEVLNFRNKHRTFVSNNILFASIAFEKNLTYNLFIDSIPDVFIDELNFITVRKDIERVATGFDKVNRYKHKIITKNRIKNKNTILVYPYEKWYMTH
jgi:hypothetical protein